MNTYLKEQYSNFKVFCNVPFLLLISIDIILSRWTTVCCQGIAPASLLKYVSGKNPLMLIAQIYYFTLDARELTRPMCFDLSRVARAAIAWRVSLAWRSRPMCFPLKGLSQLVSPIILTTTSEQTRCNVGPTLTLRALK